MLHRLILALTFAVVSIPIATALAQGPASREQQAAACRDGFASLRRDAEQKGTLIKAAGERHAPLREACGLVNSYLLASAKMIKYVEANADGCGIPASIVERLKATHRQADDLRSKVCAKAGQSDTLEGPSRINDFGDPAFRRRAF